MNKAAFTDRASILITGSSEMAGRIRAFDWSRTPLQPIDEWSETLIATVNLMLHSPFPTILSWGPEMVFLYNDAAISTLTLKHPGALGDRFRDVFHESWDLVRGDLEACFYRGESPVRENMFIPILINGVLEDHYWSYSLIPVYENTQISGLYNAFRNMTAAVLGAQRLRESEARLKLATEVAKLGVFAWDTSKDIASWENDRMYEIFGRTREQGPLSGTEFLLDGIHPDSRDHFRQAFERTVEKGEPLHFEGSVYLPDKSLRRIEINGNLQLEPDTSKPGVLGTVRDITEIRKIEHALRVSSKHLAELAAIVDSSDDAILSKDLNGIVTSWNAAATRVLGYTAEEIIGSSVLKLIPEHLHSDESDIIQNIRAGKRLAHFDTVRLTKDGQSLDVSLTISPIRDAEGRVIGASTILRDISARKLLEKSLLQAEKIAATGRMAATIAHEINNPLAAVVNLLFLLRPLVATEQGVNYLASAESELARVSHIAKQTLGYYRDNGAASRASLSAIAEQASAIYEPRCIATGITLKKSLQSSSKVMLRRGEMMQVISNLIMNSIYAMSAGGTLSVSVTDVDFPSDGVLLTVTDNGMGIAPEIMPKVFEAFFTTRSTVGTGIGLFISRQFVEGHSGTISIESDCEPETHGTTVRVLLPLRTAYELSAV